MTLKLTSGRWNIIQNIVDQLFDLDASEQLSTAKQLCGEDTKLFDEVIEVLKHQDSELTFLESPAINSLFGDQPEELAIKIEGYTLCERVGIGGMGVVYRAERDQGDFTQEVAIKLLPQWRDKDELRQRFRQEQQLLADLEHPSVARLYGGGMSKEGLPFLIMEYVRGESIDHYCSRNDLSIRDRLNLIKQVAQALEHAHSRLVVHRDIKPSNILVTPDGQIKLLDFGIAKLIGDVDPNLTRTDDQVMTPGFAAPEQILNLPVTVATDVYQLGLVAYLLLTDQQAYARHAGSVADMVKAICEETPNKPSEVALQIRDDSGKSAPLWSNTSKGEIDAIVLAMLRNQQNERYASMAAVIADLDAYFEHRPISRLSQSTTYQVKKWLRRYRVSVAAIAVFLTMVLAYAVTTTVQARRIELALGQSVLERQKAESVSDLMVDMFKAADPNTSGIETITAQQLLEQGLRKIEKDLSLNPAIQAKILTSIGEIYYSQGQIDKSRDVLEQALTKQNLVRDGSELELAKTLTNLAVIYNQTASQQEAEKLYKKSLILQLAQFSGQQEDQRYIANLAETYNGLGVLLIDKGDLDGAENRIQEALKLLSNAALIEHEQYANALSNLATIRITQGQLEEASIAMKEVIHLQEKASGDTHPFFSLYLVSLANVLIKLEDYKQARSYIDRAIILQRQVLGENHPDLASSKRNLGVLLHRKGDLIGAEKQLRESLVIRDANYTKPSFMTANTYRLLADVLIDQQRHIEATQLLTNMRDYYTAVGAGQTSIGLGVCSNGLIAYRQGKFEKANVHYEEAITMLAGNELRLAIAYTGYAQSLLKLSSLESSLKFAEQAFNIRSNKLPAGHSLIAEAEATLGLALIANKQSMLGKEHLARALPALKRNSSAHIGGSNSLFALTKQQLQYLDSL